MRLHQLVLLILTIVIFMQPVSASMQKNFTSDDDVIVNQTYLMSDSTAIPMDMWLLSIILAIALIIISFIPFKNGEEGIAAGMAVFPAAFAYASAFNVESITVSGLINPDNSTRVIAMSVRTIFHFDLIAYTCLLPLLILAFINIGRIYLNYKEMKRIAAQNGEKGT